MKKFIIFLLCLVLVFGGYHFIFSYEVEDVVLIDVRECDQTTIISLDMTTSARHFDSYQIENEDGIYTIIVKTSFLSSKSWPQEIIVQSKKENIKAIEVKNPRNNESKVLFPNNEFK